MFLGCGKLAPGRQEDGVVRKLWYFFAKYHEHDCQEYFRPACSSSQARTEIAGVVVGGGVGVFFFCFVVVAVAKC